MSFVKPSTRQGVFACVLLLGGCATTASEIRKERNEVDTMERKALGDLFKEQPSSRKLFSAAHGYAVFRGTQTALMISGGGGKGVAINKRTGKRTYMRMTSAGIGVGFGVQILTTVIFFEDSARMTQFVEEGWDADTSASAAAIEEGVNIAGSFVNGLAVYQMTEKGLIAQASVKGTKYWKDDTLNKGK